MVLWGKPQGAGERVFITGFAESKGAQGHEQARTCTAVVPLHRSVAGGAGASPTGWRVPTVGGARCRHDQAE